MPGRRQMICLSCRRWTAAVASAVRINLNKTDLNFKQFFNCEEDRIEMASKVKSECLQSKMNSKTKDLQLHWEDQRRMWESQRKSQFSILFEEKNIDTNSKIGSKEEIDDKMIELNCSKYKFNFGQSNNCMNKKVMSYSINSCMEVGSSLQNYTKIECDKHAYCDETKPNQISNITINNAVKQDSVFTKQNTNTKFSSKLLIHQFSPIGINLPKHQTVSNSYFVNKNETIKSESTQYFFQPTYGIIICFVCDQQVKKGELALHLFFGQMKCNDCGIKVFDCKSFMSDLYISSNCIHNQLSWLENPLEYLKSKLNQTPKVDNENIYQYMKCLKPLEQLSPWKFAFQKYHIFMNFNLYSDTKSELVDEIKCENEIKITDEVLLFESYDIHQMEHAVQLVDIVEPLMFQEKNTEVISKSKFIKNDHAVKFKKSKRKTTIPIKHIIKHSERSDTDQKHILLHEEQISYNNKILTEEFDEIKKTTKNNKYRKDKHDKKKKENPKFNFKNSDKPIESIWPYSIKYEKQTAIPNDYQIEFLDLPKDGNYLVTHNPIEECPICYIEISLYNCVVNIKLLLYTFWCQCGLKIFYLPKTPDNIDHPVKIIEMKNKLNI